MNELRQTTTLITAASLLFFVLYQLGQIFKNRRISSANWYVFTSLAAFLALTLLLDGVSEWLDKSTGLNNFSWYLGYSLGVIACASAGLTDCETAREGRYSNIARFLILLAVIVLALKVAIYARVIVYTPEWTERVPRSWYEVIFSTSFFGYAAIVTIAALYIGKVSLGDEENPLVQLRLRVSNLCRYAGILCFVAKVLYLVLEFPFGGFGWLNRLALLAMTVTGLLWLMMLMPKQLYLWMLRIDPWQSYQTASQVRTLEQLRNLLATLVPIPTQPQTTTIRLRPRDTQSALYRVVIQILDAKKILDGYLAASPVERKRYTEIAWSEEQWQQAYALHEALQAVNQVTNESVEDVAAALLVVARQDQTQSSWLRPLRSQA